jgi:hypothetical protein
MKHCCSRDRCQEGISPGAWNARLERALIASLNVHLSVYALSKPGRGNTFLKCTDIVSEKGRKFRAIAKKKKKETEKKRGNESKGILLPNIVHTQLLPNRSMSEMNNRNSYPILGLPSATQNSVFHLTPSNKEDGTWSKVKAFLDVL